MKAVLAITVVAGLLLSGPAVAQGVAPAAPAKPAASSALAKAAKPAPKRAVGGAAQAPRSAASLECSKQADAQGLHGKARKTFRGKCKQSGK